MAENTLFTFMIEDGESLLNFDHPGWDNGNRVSIERDCQGRALIENQGINWKNLTQVSSRWSRKALFFYFECWYDTIDLFSETVRDHPPGIHQQDTVGLLLRPESCEDYFQLEVTPLGHLLDSHILEPRVDVDFNWDSESEIKVSVHPNERIWRAVVQIPFDPIQSVTQLKSTPVAGDVWSLNLSRNARAGSRSDFALWRPTFTPQPDFHRPDCFGNMFFLEE